MPAFNFRATAGYVVDGTGETYVTAGDVYPTVRGGFTFGWDAPVDNADRDSSLDRRLAGINFRNNTGAQNIFRVDLPTLGTYDIRLSLGDPVFGASYLYAQFLENGAVFLTIDDTNGEIAGHVDDATGVDRTTAVWLTGNVAITRLFTSTIFAMRIGSPMAQAGATTVTHLSLALIAATIVIPPPPYVQPIPIGDAALPAGVGIWGDSRVDDPAARGRGDKFRVHEQWYACDRCGFLYS